MKNKKGNKGNKRYSTLEQHKLQRKKLVPPFLQIPNFKTISWLNERLPEMLWAALLISTLEREEALDVFRRVAKVLEGTRSASLIEVTQTGIAALPHDLRNGILQVLSSADNIRNALRPLLLLKDLPGYKHWSKALNSSPTLSDWDVLKLAVARNLDHQSQEATDCRWMRVLAKVVIGQMKFPTLDTFKEILYYPTYGDMRKVRPTIRATEGALASIAQGDNTWAQAFWRQCFEETECELGFIRHSSGVKPGTTVERVRNTRQALVAHFKKTAQSTDVDANHEGTFGLAAYALAILDELLRVGNSTSILGRLALRTLLECYVTLVYLSSSSDQAAWQAYRNYGAGQAKLAFLKLDDDYVTPPDYISLETLQLLANEDRWMEFTEINVGHWDNSNLRAMSEKAQVKAEYDRYYPWTSGFVHGNWAAVRNAVFELCMNPLHRLHRVVRSETNTLEDVLPDACALVDKILQVVDSRFPTFSDRVSL